MTAEELKLLHNYLSKYIQSETAKEWEECQVLAYEKLENGNVDIIARSLGEVSFTFFNLFYLGHIFRPNEENTARELATVHYALWSDLEDMFLRDTHDKELFILPRGIGKSTIINLALTVWTHCYRKSLYTIVLANVENDGVAFLESIKKVFDEEKIINAFGKLVDKKIRTVNKVECELDNNTKIKVFSSGSSVRGTNYCAIRPTLVIADDYQDISDIITDEAKFKKYDRWLKDVEEVGEKKTVRNGKVIKNATKFLVIGTPLAQDCFVNRMRNNAEYRVFHRSVLSFKPDAYFELDEYWKKFREILFDDKTRKRMQKAEEYYYKNESHMQFETIWSKYNCLDIAKSYYVKRNQFLQELMCDCESVGEKWVKTTREITADEMNDVKFKKTMLCCDPASGNSQESNYDFCAFCVGSLGFNDLKYVREGIIKRIGFNDYTEQIMTLLKKYKDITHIYIEKNLYLGADVIKLKDLIEKDAELKNRKLTIINEMQRSNKDLKIGSIIDYINTGQVIFNKDNKDFNDQVRDFSGQKTTKHDDAIESVAEFVIRIDTIKSVGEIKIMPNWFLYS